jgi:polysaccharide biosynthesis transport protein
MGQQDFRNTGGALIGASGQPLVPDIRDVSWASVISDRQETSLLALARAIWRHRGVISLAALVFMVCTGVYVANQKPLYTAEGAIVVASRKIMIPGVEAISTPTGDIAIIRSEMGVLASRTLLDEVASDLHLGDNPEFNPLLRPKNDSFFAKLDPWPFLERVLMPGTGAPVDRQAYVTAAVEARLEKHLTLINNEKDYVIRIRFESESPKTSAAVVNTLMSRYLSQYAQIKTSAAREADASLNARADELRREANQAEAAVAQFVKDHKLIATQSGSINAQELEDLNTQLAMARSERAAAEARYRDALALVRSGTSDANAEVLSSPLIQALRTQEAELARKQAELNQQVGPNYPDLRAVRAQLAQLRGTIQAEVGKIMTSLKGQATVARAREVGLEDQFSRLQSAAVAGNAAFNELQQLKSAADAKRQIYAGFLSKLAETAKPDEHQPVDARIISQAVAPVEPSGARGVFFILISGVVGSLLAIAGCLTRDQLDRGFTCLEHVRSVTGLPAYAAIPPLRGRWRWPQSARYVVDYPHSTLAETMRGVRARLRWAGGDQRVMLVTSAQPGEGKTSFALSLAQVIAIDGWRTLLIEGDSRSPVLRRVFSASASADPAEVLSGQVPWGNRVGRDDRTGLYYFISNGAGAGFSALVEQHIDQAPMEQIKSAFDYVIIDSPPVLRVADATVLARIVDTIVFVVAAKRTRQRTVVEGLRRLLVAGKPLGVVLTNTGEQPSEEDVYAGYPRARRRRAAFFSQSPIG